MSISDSGHFHFLQTQDGSPSLRMGPIEEHSESMHSFRGAFSETVYIYGQAVQKALEHGLAPSFFSLGLGLGYNELLTTALILGWQRHDPEFDLKQVQGESFEAVPELNQMFKAWLGGKSVREDFAQAYTEILRRCCEHVSDEKNQVTPSEVGELFLKWIHAGQWRLQGALDDRTDFKSRRFSCFLFDAFSSKTSPSLWTEEFLTRLFSQQSSAQAVFSTYACTGALKRSLRGCGFTLNIREGFASKRDSTFATRGLV